MDVFQKLQYDLKDDLTRSKKSGKSSEVETIHKELALTKTYLQQAEIDRENLKKQLEFYMSRSCLLYTSPSPRDQRGSRMPSSA